MKRSACYLTCSRNPSRTAQFQPCPPPRCSNGVWNAGWNIRAPKDSHTPHTGGYELAKCQLTNDEPSFPKEPVLSSSDSQTPDSAFMGAHVHLCELYANNAMKTARSLFVRVMQSSGRSTWWAFQVAMYPCWRRRRTTTFGMHSATLFQKDLKHGMLSTKCCTDIRYSGRRLMRVTIGLESTDGLKEILCSALFFDNPATPSSHCKACAHRGENTSAD